MWTRTAPNRWLIGQPGLVDDPNVFPQLPGQFFYAKKSPIWSTLKSEAASGFERCAQLQSYPRWEFEFPYNFIRDNACYPEATQLFSFYNYHYGMFLPFSFFDPADNLVSNQLIGVGDGTTTQFQLTRTLLRFTEPVFSVSGNPTVMVNGVSVGYSLANYGQVTLNSAPAAGAVVSWSGRFMFLCRFGTDSIDPSRDFSDILSLKSLPIKSIKPKRVYA